MSVLGRNMVAAVMEGYDPEDIVMEALGLEEAEETPGADDDFHLRKRLMKAGHPAATKKGNFNQKEERRLHLHLQKKGH